MKSSCAAVVADYETLAPTDIDEHPLIRKLREQTFSPLFKVSDTAPYMQIHYLLNLFPLIKRVSTGNSNN